MLSPTKLRRLIVVGLTLGTLAAIAPAGGLASNPGGGGGPHISMSP